MLWFFEYAGQRRTCEVRLAPDGQGYELVVDDNGEQHVESFAELTDLLAREHELVTAWKAMGWRDVSGERTFRRGS